MAAIKSTGLSLDQGTKFHDKTFHDLPLSLQTNVRILQVPSQSLFQRHHPVKRPTRRYEIYVVGKALLW